MCLLPSLHRSCAQESCVTLLGIHQPSGRERPGHQLNPKRLPSEGKTKVSFHFDCFGILASTVTYLTVRGPVESEKMLCVFFSTCLFHPELEGLWNGFYSFYPWGNDEAEVATWLTPSLSWLANEEGTACVYWMFFMVQKRSLYSFAYYFSCF